MKPVEGRRSLLSRLAFTVVGGCMCMILLVQPACSGGDESPVDGAPGSLFDASGRDGAVDSSVGGDATTITFDARTMISACWATAAASYTDATHLCGIGNTTLSVSGSEVQLSPFGTNGAVLFTPTAVGSGSVAWATGLTILGAADSTCSVTCVPARGAIPATISIFCAYSGSSQCTQNPQRAN